MARTVFTAWIWFVIAVDTFLVFVVIGLLRPFDPDQKISYHLANFWGWSIIRANPFWKVTTSGANHIKNNRSYVLVANHSSIADIAFLYLLGKHYKWVSKDSLFKIPFFGWTMSLLNYIPLRRGERGSIRESFKETRRWLEKGISVLFFPEGTRSKTGQLGEFKNGAFKIAILTQKPIIPIVIQGAHEVISKGEIMVAAKFRASVNVLPEVSVAGYEESDYETLKTNVRNLMLDALRK